MILLGGDFSQQEMRVQAHEAKCKAMIDMFLKGIDLHTGTAERIFGVPHDTAKETRYRYPSKTLNFSIIYMVSPQGLYENIHEQAMDIIVDGKPMDVSEWTLDSCAKLIEDWYKVYPEVRDYQYERIAQARRYGYVTDMFGRRRYIPEVSCPIRDIREPGERQAVNFPIQAGSQGITKLSMARSWKEWKQRYTREQCRFLMQIHDELLLEVDEELVQDVAWWLKRVMEGVVSLSVPMIAEFKSGTRWGELSKLELAK